MGFWFLVSRDNLLFWALSIKQSGLNLKRIILGLMSSWNQEKNQRKRVMLVDQPELEPGHVPPSIQVAPRGNEVVPSNQPPRVVPYLYQLDVLITRLRSINLAECPRQILL